MTTRRLNFTGRQRIRVEDARITLETSTRGPAEFEASLRLSEYGFPADALVVVEAYRQTSAMRFDFGTVAFRQPPDSTKLVEFDPPDGVRFRVKVVDASDRRGLLLGSADEIRPTSLGESPAQCILDVVFDLFGEEVWRLSLDDVDAPKLQVNNKLMGRRTTIKEPRFFALVFPEVLRQILREAVRDGRPGEGDPPWQTDWCLFAESLPGVKPAPEVLNDADGEEWVQRAVEAFSRQSECFSRFLRVEEGES